MVCVELIKGGINLHSNGSSLFAVFSKESDGLGFLLNDVLISLYHILFLIDEVFEF